MAAIDLCTVADVKEGIQLPSTELNLDALIPEYITQASRAIINHCKRQFLPVQLNTTKRFMVTSYRCDFSPWDLRVTGMTPIVTLHPETVNPYVLTPQTATTNAQYIFKPVNPERGVYQSLQFSGFLVIVSMTLMAFNFALVDITGDWGFPSVPEDVNRACVITVGSWLTRTAPGASGAWGVPAQASMGAMPRVSDWHIPYSAKKLLGEYRRGSSRWAQQ